MKCARAYYRWLLALPYFLSSVRAATNVTVDDEYGDSETGATPTYSPSSGVWNQGNTCTGCLVKPDSSETFDGTWHDTTWAPNDQPRTITINFTGVAVYAYFILANTVTGATTLTNMSFTLDGNVVGHFAHVPTTSTEYIYNYAAYVNKTLSNTEHEFVISTAGTTNVLILFDELIYTTEENATSTSISTASSATSTSASDQVSETHSNHTGAIVGGVVAAIVVILIITSLIFFLHRRKKKHNKLLIQQEQTATARPFDMIEYRQANNHSESRNVPSEPDERLSFLPAVTVDGSNGATSSSGNSDRPSPSTVTTAAAEAIALSNQFIRNARSMSNPTTSSTVGNSSNPSQSNLGLTVRNGDSGQNARLQALSEKASLLESIVPSTRDRSQAGSSSGNGVYQRVDSEHVLMDRITTLEAEVARLNGRSGDLNADEPPPDYYTTGRS